MKRKKWLKRIKFLAVATCMLIVASFFCAEAVDVEVAAATDELVYTFHEFGDWVEETAPTCQHDGVEISQCRHCNVTRRRITKAFDHCYVSEIITKATVNSEGLKRFTCIWCGASYDEAIPAITATYTEEFVSPADDPAGIGYVLHRCEEDDAFSYTSPLTYTTKVYAPTCLEEGYTLYICNEGDYSYKSDYTAKTTHNWVEISRYAPNCNDTGIIYYKCTICYSNITVTKPSLGHSYVTDKTRSVEATCTTAGRDYAVCSRCGEIKDEVIPALGHNYVLNTSKSVAPTADAEGLNYYVCSRCGAIKKEIVPATGTTENTAVKDDG